MIKRILSGLLACVLVLCPLSVKAASPVPYYIYDVETSEPLEEYMPVAADAALTVAAPSAVLMDMTSGQVLFEQNSHEARPIASVTKVMTLLLVMEAIDDGRIGYDEEVSVSAKAASMGGSQIWLEENERMTVRELLKAAVIVSANDACAALAEHLCGTTEAFVTAMNERAKELGGTDTQFVDCSGLDDAGQSSAHDIALFSRELMMKHPAIQEYTTVWMDSLRNGQSELVNTNRLVRFYNGATGLKTGTTAAAGCCLSATATREGLSLCAVVLGAGSSNDRFQGARSMLDYGFANYAVYTPPAETLKCDPVTVEHGTGMTVEVVPPAHSGMAISKRQMADVTVEVHMNETVEAPVEKGQVLGEAIVRTGEEELMRLPMKAAHAVEKMSFARALMRFAVAATAGQVV